MLECPSILLMVSIGTPLLERDQGGERMSSHVVDEVLAEPRHQAQGFHVGPERMVVLRREEGDAGIVTILPINASASGSNLTRPR